MAINISEGACVQCGACVDECPVGALSMGDNSVVVDEGSCIECGICANACPSDALSL